jgi:acetate---CoA ligase (ADP-forming) subunit alpha
MIRDFFYPNSIAVIGATANPKKFGNAVTINILKNKGLRENIYLVSKGTKEIEGKKIFKSILDIPNQVDIAIILVPSKIVEAIVEECIQKEVKGIIIITAGFGEIDELGKIIENRIAYKCKNAGIRVIGPNCVGIQNNEIDLNASFIQAAPKGNISMISQSGSFACATFYAMEKENLGCSKFANIGNNIDVSFVDILRYFNDDQKSKIICIYMETINDGKEFYRILSNIIFDKPVVILKGGKTEYGMKAASSHTGAIATNYKMLKTAIKQAGAILCEDIDDYILALKAFSLLPLPDGEKIGVLTNSGGSSVLFSDKAEEYGLKLAEFSTDLLQKIKPYLISLVKLVNPLDMIGVAEEKQYYQITKAMLEDSNIDIVVPCLVVPPFLEMSTSEHYRGMINAWNDTSRKKPLIPLILMGHNFKKIKALAIQENAPIFYTPHEAAYTIKLLIERKMKAKQKF